MSETTHRPGELPPPLMTSEPGSFARRTIVERKPQIIRQVLANNDYPPDIVRDLETFREEIASRPMQPLRERAPDAAAWNRALAGYGGGTWLQVSWYWAETFFYRRLLEAVRYFQPGPWQARDPFAAQKGQQVDRAVAQLAGDWPQIAAAGPEVAFEALLHSCLWGNRADLSNYTVNLRVPGGLDACQERHNILIDHTERVRPLLTAGLQRVDFVNDNVGLDLLFDLALADLLLVQGWARRVVFHLKNQPFFVSDALPADVQATLAALEPVPDLAGRLRDHLAAGRLRLASDPFWTSHLMFDQMPPALRAELQGAGLILFKGDANYRRLLADRHWPPTARLEGIVDYLPAPFLVLRTLKSEIVVGLAPGQAEALTARDPTWLTDGRRGIIQLGPGGR